MNPSRPVESLPPWLRPTRVLAMTLAALAATGVRAQPAAPARPPPCAAPEHRQFDFWIGTWEVFGPAGRKVGENRIERIADGCALLEQWAGTGNVTGKSLNIYDVGDGRWHQTWVDSSGTLLILAGGMAERSMVMSASTSSASDPTTTVIQRITWTPADDGSVRQLWETSKDGGRTWIVAFDGRYVRAK